MKLSFSSSFLFALISGIAVGPKSTMAQVATGDEHPQINQTCYTGFESPMFDDVPYIDLNAMQLCDDPTVPVRSCGFQYYLDGVVERNNLVSSKLSDTAPPTWKAMDNFGKYMGKGGELAAIYLRFKEAGTILTPHWHRNTEVTFLAKGRAKVTVAGYMKASLADKKNCKKNGGGRTLRGGCGSNDDDEPDVFHSETFVATAGDAYYVPPGFTHQVQSLSDDPNDPMEVLILFDIGMGNAVRLQDALYGFTNKPDLMAKALDVPRALVDQFQYYDKDHFNPPEGWTIEEGLQTVTTSDPVFKISQLGSNLIPAPRVDTFGPSSARIVDGRVSDIIDLGLFSVGFLEIAPGAEVEPYYLGNTDELLYILEGDGLEFQLAKEATDCWDVFTVGKHSMVMHEYGQVMTIRNHGPTTARIYRTFNNNRPDIMTLQQAYQESPEDVVRGVLYPSVAA